MLAVGECLAVIELLFLALLLMLKFHYCCCAGSVLTAGLVGAVKLVSGLFGLGEKPSRASDAHKKQTDRGQSSKEAAGKQDGKDS